MNVYDFDDTIYDGDTNRDLMKYSFKRHPFLVIKALLKTIIPFIKYKLGKVPFERVKEVMLSFLFELDDTEGYIKSFVKDECPTIYKVLYNKDGKLNYEQFENIISYLMRVEKTYLKGDKKLSLFKKIKNAFSSEKEIDTSEIKKLSLKIASIRKKLKRQKVEEGIIDYDYELLVLEANIEVLEELVIE